MGWSYDVANRLFLRYGGCSGYHNELTVFDSAPRGSSKCHPNKLLIIPPSSSTFGKASRVCSRKVQIRCRVDIYHLRRAYF